MSLPPRTGVASLLIETLVLFSSTLLACDSPVERVSPEIVLTLPHDTAAYTQGLIFHNQVLWESTGRFGESTIRRVDPRTGNILLSRTLPDSIFGEGLALVDSTLVQLTWKAGLAFVYDLDSLNILRTFRYDGEGWGLCFDGVSLYMTNGSDSLYRRDPKTFSVLEVQQVTAGGMPVRGLNELECVEEHVWANVYQEDRILEIEKATGRAVRELDGFQLRLASGIVNDGDAVLKGVAYAPMPMCSSSPGSCGQKCSWSEYPTQDSPGGSAVVGARRCIL